MGIIKVKDNNVIWKKMIINNKKRNRGRLLDQGNNRFYRYFIYI